MSNAVLSILQETYPNGASVSQLNALLREHPMTIKEGQDFFGRVDIVHRPVVLPIESMVYRCRGDDTNDFCVQLGEEHATIKPIFSLKK